MNSNNSVPVKIGYYVLFFILITIKISIIVLLYGFIYKKNIGTAFDTHLENTLTTENVLFDHNSTENIIHPSFIDIYKQNISNENDLLNHTKYKKYVVSIDKIEIFGLKFLGIALFIMLVSLKKQEYIEDFTNETINKLGNLNVLIIAIIIVILFAIASSIYLFIKFMKMRKLLSIKKGDDDDLLLLKQGLLYEDLTNIISIEKTIPPNFNKVIDNKMKDEGLTPKERKILKNQQFPPKLNAKTLATFYTNNGGKEGSLPAPFNGGNNKYGKIYETTTYMGIIISGASIAVSIISLIIIYRRAK